MKNSTLTSPFKIPPISLPSCAPQREREQPIFSFLWLISLLGFSLPRLSFFSERKELEGEKIKPASIKTPKMDVYGGLSTTTAPDYFHIDDLLDFSNDDLLSSPSSSIDHHHHLPPPETSSIHHHHFPSSTYVNNPSSLSTDFTDHLSVPIDDVAELEWLSQFVEDSFSDFPSIINIPTDTSFCNKSRSKRSRATATTATSSSPELETAVTGKSRLKKENNGAPHSPAEEGTVRRCTHCASEKTPQWRTGPLGPKTLCNACGVRYKSGRLVPEYRPAASPTFVLTRHSNSHRKVLELRRQKEMTVRQQQQQQHGYQGYEVC